MKRFQKHATNDREHCRIPSNAQRKRENDGAHEDRIEAEFALEIQQRIEAGATREEAELSARSNFGNVT